MILSTLSLLSYEPTDLVILLSPCIWFPLSSNYTQEREKISPLLLVEDCCVSTS